MTGIYKITNKVNGKVYVGQSVSIERRWKEHLKATDNYPVHNALRKYGFENFDFEIIALCDRDELNRLEQFYIQEYDCVAPNGYNLTSGGERDFTCSEETKKKLSEAAKGRSPWNKGKHTGPQSEESNRKRSEAQKGKPRPWLQGRHLPEETRKKMSEVKKGVSRPKLKWLTPSGEIIEMTKSLVHRHHPDWTEVI